MTIQTQANDPVHAEFVEHMRWTHQNITFATLHVVGSQNGLKYFSGSSSAKRSSVDDAEVKRRIAATIAWIRGTFAAAIETQSPGVLFLFHANPAFEAAAGTSPRKGFDALLTVLRDEAIAFGRPVVLVHGDTHSMRVNKPMRMDGVAIANITRIETFGDPDYHWLRVVVDPKSREVFSVRQEIVAANRD
jgi:hypothetical protein